MLRTTYACSLCFKCTFNRNCFVISTALAGCIEIENQTPDANNLSLATDEDTPKAITLAGNDSDGSISTYTVSTNPVHGALSGTAPNLTYTPAANYFGSDSFTFTVTDNEGATSAAVAVSITVNSVNDGPTATGQTTSTNEDTPKAITLAGSDSDGSISTYTVSTNPVHGALSGTAPNLTYTPAANYFGSDSFTFTVTDNEGATSAAVAVSITVNSVNDGPTATGQTMSTNEDTPKAITLAGNDSDGSISTYTVSTNPVHGALSGTGPNLTYTPASQLFWRRQLHLYRDR
ncbi:Ig-like domain-containing protein [Candidatus Reidiella endopervernicosa]|uniref:Tandem-95 repeat protein n=1 Tax=Candidatus Reidiella endopervernicosa TaxID=2738883 RepID=A0A6N0HX31_9GAMM|nr:Ig-like domain-containing protein [Candidatus Reidiella endopervernicosa]QKQ26811.1 tandem-95 repeat protein [Candidatus Reidiella endopervernicosa]